MPVTSIFSLSHNIFYPIKNRNHYFSNILFVFCKYFEFGPFQNFVTPYQTNKKLDMTNSKLLAGNKSIVAKFMAFKSRNDRKHCGDRRKCCISAFSPFSLNVFKGLPYLESLKLDLCSKGFTNFTLKLHCVCFK